MPTNFTLQHIFGSLLASANFPLIFVIPSCVIGWLLDLFDFRKYLLLVRFVIAIVLSNPKGPMMLHHRLGFNTGGWAPALSRASRNRLDGFSIHSS